MSPEHRNKIIVAFLIGSMTLGAALLLWLEPATPHAGDALLIAQTPTTIDDATITCVGADDPGLADFDCLVNRDGEVQWQLRGGSVRIGVLSADQAHLEDAQARGLLAALAGLVQSYGLNPARVELAADCDPRLNRQVSGAAYELYGLLARKDLIR